MSQCDEILEAMRRGERLTADNARVRFRCRNLKGRIWDIKQKVSDKIERQWFETPDGARVAVYFIEAPPRFINTNVRVGENLTIFN